MNSIKELHAMEQTRQAKVKRAVWLHLSEKLTINRAASVAGVTVAEVNQGLARKSKPWSYGAKQ